jgi:hypothetical protein
MSNAIQHDPGILARLGQMVREVDPVTLAVDAVPEVCIDEHSCVASVDR